MRSDLVLIGKSSNNCFATSLLRCWSKTFDTWPYKSMYASPVVNIHDTNTPCSKRKYTLCFPVSTQNVAGAWPLAVLRDRQWGFPNNQARVCEEIPNGSKVLRESLLGCCVRKFTKIYFCHRLLCYWLIKGLTSNSDLELWNHLDFFHKPSFGWHGTSMGYPPYLLMGPTWCRFEYLPTETQSVYFLLELSVHHCIHGMQNWLHIVMIDQGGLTLNNSVMFRANKSL